MNAAGKTVVALISRTLNMQYLVEAMHSAFAAQDLTIELRVADVDGGPAALGNGAEIDLAVCWEPYHGLWPLMPNVRLVQSLAAGVDHILEEATVPQAVPVARIRDPHMASAMAAYVTWAVTSEHRQMDSYLQAQAKAVWSKPVVVPATQYRVGIAGMGTLGAYCARVLAAIGYEVRGWSRNPSATPIEGVQHFAGDSERAAFLDGLNALVCLLPLTDSTRGVMNRGLFAQLAPGAHIVNVGRGAHVVDADLIAALDAGQLGCATLDTFVIEPLPSTDPLWHHPKVRITPHIATRTSATVIATQSAHHWMQVLAGAAPDHAVDLSRGY